ncbi:MAG: DNA primase [Bacilli bacterium]|nr:DNA primase [Bacilli bacterium]
MAYSNDLIDAVRQAADIVTVVSSYISVERHGRNYLAICPFHDDKNPSMTINRDKQIYKCFACGAGGNVITFVKNYEKVSFPEAVRKVADLVGFSDPRLVEDAPKIHVDESKKKLFDCIAELNAYYQYGLSVPEGQVARDYLEKRNIDETQQKKYGIGYALNNGELTVRYLLSKGYSLKNIEDIGIVFARSENASDTNVGRVTFPLHDAYGHVVGFSARRLDSVHEKKYVVTRDGALFHKGDLLYNYHNVVSSARHDGYCYVLEGFMDVMALDRAGIPNAVAIMGTALTNEHIELLRKLRCELRLCLDGDEAGQKGMMKMGIQLSKANIPYRFVDYGNDLRDPDEILQQEGKEALKAKMENLLDPIDFQIAFYQRTEKLDTPEERKRVLMGFLPFVKSLPLGIERENYIVKLSKITKYEPDAIRALLAQETPKAETREGAVYRVDSDIDTDLLHPEKALLRRLMIAEKTILYYMLQEPQAVEFFKTKVKDFTIDVYEEVAMAILEYSDAHPGKVDTSGIIGLLESKESEDSGKAAEVVNSLAFEKNHVPFSMKLLSDCLDTIVEEKESIHKTKEVKQALSGDDLKSNAAALDAYAKSKGKNWPKKKKGGSSS